MKKSFLNFSLVFILFLVISSCNKKDDVIIDEPIKTPPTITFVEPSQSMYMPIGVTVPISGLVSDDEEVKSMSIVISNTTTPDSIFIVFDNVNQKDYNFDTSFVANAPTGSHTNFEIRIIAFDNKDTKAEAYKFVHVMD